MVNWIVYKNLNYYNQFSKYNTGRKKRLLGKLPRQSPDLGVYGMLLTSIWYFFKKSQREREWSLSIFDFVKCNTWYNLYSFSTMFNTKKIIRVYETPRISIETNI